MLSSFQLSNKRSADQNNLDISHSDQVTMGTQTADLQQDGQPVANGLVSHNISTIYHGAWPINTGKLVTLTCYMLTWSPWEPKQLTFSRTVC